MTLSRTIATVLASDEATYSIAKRTSLHVSAITNLRNGTKPISGLRLTTAEKLANDTEYTARHNVSALLKSQISGYAISKATNISDGTIAYLRNGKKQLDNLQLENVEKLAHYYTQINRTTD